MPYKEDLNQEYTIVNSQERNDPTMETMINYEQPNGLGRPESIQDDDTYDITRLDYIWYPILMKRLENGNISKRSTDGVPLVRVSSENDDTVDYVPASDRPLSSFDEIDARGSFNAQELERDLRQIPRHDLGRFIDINHS